MRYNAVMVRPSSFQRLAPFAEDQWGFVTRRQTEKAGLAPATIARLAHAGDLERVAHGVYHLRGAPQPSHADLRAAWLQLAPGVPAWERTPEDGVVSHRSAAALYGIGHLPADVHEFTVPGRRQSRRSDVRLHVRPLEGVKWITLDGLPSTRPSRITSDLLRENEDPEAVAQLIADAIREVYDHPGTFADSLAPYAARFSLRSGDGLALLRWFLGLVGDPETQRWLDEARAHVERRPETHVEKERLASGIGREDAKS
ncbi:MAG: type IV toxin-antitoxin system AbiEi family antitoxin domain-containing protein [Acidimicrobiia bacterium]